MAPSTPHCVFAEKEVPQVAACTEKAELPIHVYMALISEQVKKQNTKLTSHKAALASAVIS